MKRAKRAPARKVAPARAKRKVAPARKRAPARDVFAQTERAIRSVAPVVKPGLVKVKTTRRLTPTRAGFRALRSTLTRVQKSQRVRGRPALYTYQLSVRFRGPDGRFVSAELSPAGFPAPATVRKLRRKGEREAQTFERLVENRIKAATFRSIESKLGLGAAVASKGIRRDVKKGSAKRARKLLRDFKAQRGATFKVRIDRVVTGADGEAKTGVPRRTRHRRRRKR